MDKSEEALELFQKGFNCAQSVFCVFGTNAGFSKDACLRIAGEVFREPDASLILGLSRGTFYSLFMIAFGVFLRLRPARPLAIQAP